MTLAEAMLVVQDLGGYMWSDLTGAQRQKLSKAYLVQKEARLKLGI